MTRAQDSVLQHSANRTGAVHHLVEILYCFVLFAGALAGPSAAAVEASRIAGQAHVTDGDTLSIGPVIIRLHGIDAPEAGQTCTDALGQSWQCGTAAADRLSALVQGHHVECVALERDAYRRLVSTCSVDSSDLAETLIVEGLAWAFTRYSDSYVEVEAKAQAAGVGIWAANNQPAWDYRASRWDRAAALSPRPACPIKGNISRDGERIYHTPWSPQYERTRINEEAGERWFCDEAEAVAAGWRAARRR